MQVVAGKAKGIKLESVPGDSTRPILDRIKTSLFDILRPELTDTSMLDLFAGSGSVGIEALSQGASQVCFIDCNRRAIETIKTNLKRTKLNEQARVVKNDAFKILQEDLSCWDFIFVAPPQYKQLWSKALEALDQSQSNFKKDLTVIVQIDPSEYQNLTLSKFKEQRQKRYGNTLLIFYRLCS